eukprot:449108_1
MAQQSSDEHKQNLPLPRHGSIQWKVTGDLLRQFTNAKHKQEFYSPEFETIDGTKWRVQFAPRGYKSSEHCGIWIECVTLCANKAQIGVNYSLNIMEVDWSYDGGNTLRKDGDAKGLGKIFKSEQLNNVSALTIECVVEETMDLNKQNNTLFEWKVSNYLLAKWKNSKHKQYFFSPKFNGIGGVWYLSIYPNGLDTEGIAHLYITCESIDSDQKQIRVAHYTDIISLDYCSVKMDGKTIKKSGPDYIVCDAPFAKQDIIDKRDITIAIKVWAPASIDAHEARFVSNLYVNRKKSAKEWREYFVAPGSQVTRFLTLLGLQEYAAGFRKNKYEMMRDIKDLTKDDLKEMGVNAGKDRNVIIEAIGAYFAMAHEVKDKSVFEWKVNGDLLQQFKDAKYQKLFFSPRFNACGGEWCFGIRPNGLNTEGTAHFYLICASIESDEKGVNVCHYLEINGNDYLDIDGNVIKKRNDKIYFKSPFQHNTIQQKKEITMRIKMWRKEAMNKEETQYTSNHYAVAKKLPNEWIECAMSPRNQVRRFLAILGLSKYAAIFDKNDVFTMEELKDQTYDDLDKMGVTVHAHRKKILMRKPDIGIIHSMCAYFTTGYNPIQSQEERKEDDPVDIADYNSNIAAGKVKLADNAFVMFLGYSMYTGTSFKDLNDIHEDEWCFREIFEDQFGYHFESNEYKNKSCIWTSAAALEWIRSMRDNVLIQNDQVQYNALIFIGASHGSTNAMICSNGEPLDTAIIRSMFASRVNKAFANMPKVFIFNCCRTPFVKVKDAAVATAPGGPGSRYGLTMTGTEGNKVFGAKLSSFVAAAFRELNGKKGLYDIFKNAKKKATHTMGLALQEHDPDVDDVIFKTKPQGRGSGPNAQADNADHVRDDEVRNVLKPSYGSMDLLQYLRPLRAAGFTNKTKLCTLTEERLKEVNIKMKVFHKKELLKRIAKLKDVSQPEYSNQLSQLNAMGFMDANANIQALVAARGNVLAAIEMLLGGN